MSTSKGISVIIRSTVRTPYMSVPFCDLVGNLHSEAVTDS